MTVPELSVASHLCLPWCVPKRKNHRGGAQALFSRFGLCFSGAVL